jgi:hypothetical protein
LAGERQCVKPPGFDQGNSPRETLDRRGEELVLATTNGAPAIVAAAASAPTVLLACLLNLDAVVMELLRREDPQAADLQIVCSRLRRRSRAVEQADPLVRDRQPTDRRSPPSVLTTWLRQGLRSGMCPLCRVAHKADREYIWHFFDEGADQEDAIESVRRPFGFCDRHIEMLRQIEVEGMKSTLGLSTMFADTLAGIVEDLEGLTPGGHFRTAPCPACANRDERLRANARYLLDELATSPGNRARFEASPGLCFAHFGLVWDTAQTLKDRSLVLDVQRNAARSVLRELQEHVRKHDDKFRHEPKGTERDSWRRAIFLTAGWPAPAESATEPERLR